MESYNHYTISVSQMKKLNTLVRLRPFIPTTELFTSHDFAASSRSFINGEEFISEKSRSQRSPSIFAPWPSLSGRIDPTGNAPYQVGNVKSFICHQVSFEHEEGVKTINTLLAFVQWYEQHPRRNHFHHSTIVCGTLFRTISNANFIPVSRIMGHCTTLTTRYQYDYGQDCIIIAVPSSHFISS